MAGLGMAGLGGAEDVDPIDLHEALRIAKEEIEPQDMEELLEKAKQTRIEKEQRLEEQRRQRLSTKHKAERAEYTATDVDLFNGGKQFDPFSDYTPEPGGASDKQVNLLMTLGVDPALAVTYSKRQAGSVITKLKGKQTGGDYRMPFGKHKGKPLKDLPSGYLRWAGENLDHTDVQDNIRQMNGQQEPVHSGTDQEVPF